jgi:hypothetical protein
MASAADNFASRTEAKPSVGAVLLGEVELSRAERWFEDGLHVIHSAEFDCVAESPDAEGAVTAFVDNAYDLMLALSELDRAGEATEIERETLALIASRFARAAWDEQRREARRREAASRMRRRGEPHWGRHSPASSSSLLSPA